MLSDLWYYKQNPVKEGAPVKNTRLLALVILLIVVVAAIFRFWDVVMLFFLSAIIFILSNFDRINLYMSLVFESE